MELTRRQRVEEAARSAAKCKRRSTAGGAAAEQAPPAQRDGAAQDGDEQPAAADGPDEAAGAVAAGTAGAPPSDEDRLPDEVVAELLRRQRWARQGQRLGWVHTDSILVITCLCICVLPFLRMRWGDGVRAGMLRRQGLLPQHSQPAARHRRRGSGASCSGRGSSSARWAASLSRRWTPRSGCRPQVGHLSADVL